MLRYLAKIRKLFVKFQINSIIIFCGPTWRGGHRVQGVKKGGWSLSKAVKTLVYMSKILCQVCRLIHQAGVEKNTFFSDRGVKSLAPKINFLQCYTASQKVRMGQVTYSRGVTLNFRTNSHWVMAKNVNWGDPPKEHEKIEIRGCGHTISWTSQGPL